MSHSKRKGRNGVLLVVPESDFIPTHSWELPATIRSGKLIAANQFLCDALGYTRIHNQLQLDAGGPIKSWCVSIRRGHVFCSPVPTAIEPDGEGNGRCGLEAGYLVAHVRELLAEPIGDYEAALVECPRHLRDAIHKAARIVADAILAEEELDAAGNGNGRCRPDAQVPLPIPSASSAPSAVDPPGPPDSIAIFQEMTPAPIDAATVNPPPATRHSSPATAGDVDELAMILDHDLAEVSP